VCVLLLGGCRSLDGLTGGTPTSDAGADVEVDASPQVCEPTAGTGTLCATVHLDALAKSPGYGAFSGAGSVGADGNGFVQVYLFDKDPTDPKNGHVLPKVTLRYPPAAGSETTLSQLPITLVGTADPAQYWAFAIFEDNKSDPRGTGLLSALSGDFVTQQNIDDPVNLFPVVTLVADETRDLDLPIVPLRALTLNVKASSQLLTSAQANPNIHGDGPGAFFLYDGSLMAGAPDTVDFGQVSCLDLELQNPSRPDSVAVTFGVTATGTHNIYGNIYDYQSPDLSGTLLPDGTLETSAAIPAQATIDETNWTAVTDVEFLNVVKPKTGTVSDPIHCN